MPAVWQRVILWLYALAASLVVVGVLLQSYSLGERSPPRWVNGLHGLFALVVLVLAGALAEVGRRSLRAAPARSL